MDRSGVGFVNVWSHSNQHFIFGHWDLFNLTVGERENYFLRIHEDPDVLIGPSPIVGNSHGFDTINTFQFGHE